MKETLKAIKIERNTVARGIGPIERGDLLTVVYNPNLIDRTHILIGDAKDLIALKKATPLSGPLEPTNREEGLKGGMMTRKNTVAEIKKELARLNVEIPAAVKNKAGLLALIPNV